MGCCKSLPLDDARGLDASVPWVLSQFEERFSRLEEAMTCLALQGQQVHVEPPPVKRPDILEAPGLVPKWDDVDNRVDSKEKTWLHRVAKDGNVEEVGRLLWIYGADATLKDYGGEIPLHNAAENGNVVVCASLIAAGGVGSVNARNKHGQTPLHMASWKSHSEVVELLLDRGADATSKDHSGNTPLHRAALNGTVLVCADLIAATGGSNINAQNEYGMTALHRASGNDNVAVVRLLLERGADTKLRDNKGRTALDVALRQEVKRLLQ